MTEDEARVWLVERLSVSRETMADLERFVALLRVENARQNLVAAASLDVVWARHIVDSAQLVLLSCGALSPLATPPPSLRDGPPPRASSGRMGEWVDLGSGAGFPGLIVAALTERPVVLVESRRLRVEFLREAAEVLGVSGRVRIEGRRVEAVPPFPAAVISARAFAPLPRLLDVAHSFSTAKTLWLLPKGRGAAQEVADAQKTWRGVFHVEHSVTDPHSGVIVARGLERR